MEDENMEKIRQITREVIMPLVYRIYLEDPEDVNSFCLQYFQERQTECLKAADGGQSENGVIKDESSTEGEKRETSKRSPQGSTSLPAISESEAQVKHRVRETSSWNYPPKESRLEGKVLKYMSIDPVSNIGDEAKPMDTDADPGEFVYSDKGDSSFQQKEKEDDENNARPSVAQSFMATSQPTNPSTLEVMPSAPSLENEAESTSDVQKQVQDGGTADCSPKFTDAAAKLPKELSVEDSSVSGIASPKDSNRQGELSPNSSFGFIPDASEGKSEDFELPCCSQDNSMITEANDSIRVPEMGEDAPMAIQEKIKATTEILDSASDVLNDIAVKLNSLENSQDSQEGGLTEAANGFAGEAPEGRKSGRNPGNAKKKVSFSKEVHETVLPVEDYQNGSSSDLEAEEAVKFHESQASYVPADEGFGEEGGIDTTDTCPRRKPRGCSSQDDQPQDSCTRFNINEAWMKKWYEVHPRMDEIGPSFGPEEPGSTGEGGDISSGYRRGFRRLPGYGRSGRNGSSSESKLGSYLSTPYPLGSLRQSSFSADEMYHRPGSGRVACNFTFQAPKVEDASKVPQRFSWEEWAATRFGQARPRKMDSDVAVADDENTKECPGFQSKPDKQEGRQGESKGSRTRDEVEGDPRNHYYSYRSGSCINAQPIAPPRNVGDASPEDGYPIKSDVSSNNATATCSNSIPCVVSEDAAMQESASGSSLQDHDYSESGEQRLDSLSRGPRSMEVGDADAEGVGTGGNVIAQPEQAPEVPAGPEKMEPGLDSAAGDFAEGAGEAEEAAEAEQQQPQQQQPLPADLDVSTSSSEDTTLRADGISVQYFEEVMRDFMKEEEILNSQFRVLDLEMCSSSDGTDTGSEGEAEDGC